jgi:hypothetical protein
VYKKMDKKYRILIICAAILVLCFVGTASAKTWYVDDDGGGNFTGIQDAINSASDGDTILDKGSGEKGIDEGGGKSVIALVALPFIGFASASEMQGDDGGSGVLRAGASSIEEEKGIAKYTNIAQEIDLLKTKSEVYNDAQSEMKALSSSTTYENFTMLIGEKKCSSTHISYPFGLFYWNHDTIGCPRVIDFSSGAFTYCIRILKEAKPGTYKFQVRYFWSEFSWIEPLPLRHKINIIVKITECQNCTILTGVVTNVKDDPIYNAKIYVEKRDYESINYYTDVTGFYSTDPLRHGTYTVSVSQPFGVNVLDKVLTANITQNATLNITLQCGGILTGTVTYENGTGIYNARVIASGPSYKGAYTNTTGYYRIVGLLAGNYTVTADPPRGANLLSNSTKTSVNLEETIIMDLVLQRENQPPIASFSYSPERIV